MSWCWKPWTEREHTFFFTGLYKSCGLHRHFIFDPWRASSLYAFVPFGIIQQMLHTHTSYRCTGSLERCLWLHSYLLNEAANIIYPLIKCLFVRVKTNSEQVILYALYPNIKQTKEKIACSEFTHSPPTLATASLSIWNWHEAKFLFSVRRMFRVPSCI